MYEESDPLEELNRCCGKVCDYIQAIQSIQSSHLGHNKESDLESEEELSFSENIETIIGDVYSGLKKHREQLNKEKGFNLEKSSAYLTFQQDAVDTSGLGNTFENSKQLPGGIYHSAEDVNLEKTNSNMSKHESFENAFPKYSIGDAPDTELPGDKPVSYLEQDKYSSEMRERYIKEMEILRSKLNRLKDEMVCGDGKRLRQSESETGFQGFSGFGPKRARDNFYKIKYQSRKLPLGPPINYNRLHNNKLLKHEDSKMAPVKGSSIKKGLRRNMPEGNKFQRVKADIKRNGDLSDSDFDGSIYDEDYTNQEAAGVDMDGDDDHSVLSTATSSSNGSNAASQVGETLGSITLNETVKEEPVFPSSSQINSTDPELLKALPMQVPGYAPVQQDLEDYSNPFRVSLFSNVPPYVRFYMHDSKGPELPADITRHLKWKLTSITPVVIRRTLINSGFKLVRKSNEWTGQWGKHMKSFVFKTLKDFQKLNHFPGTFQIGRKDKLWRNLLRLMLKFGKKEFGFIPRTYILPQDSKSLRIAWEKAACVGKGQWIIKPPAAARGAGIKVVHKWGQIPKKGPLIVQKYIAKPYLINGNKFDLRLYVLMTSINPLRIYLYDDGLVRFACVKYSEDVECLNDRFMHLTNYSINKLSTQYCANEDISSCTGHKWTLKALWNFLTKRGVNVKALRKSLIDMIIKTIISGESNIHMLSKNNLPSRYCSYELFGIDVLLDHNLKPWLLEVNISPSLHSASPLDLAVKGPLVRELLNIAGFQIPEKLTKEQEENFLETYGLKDKTQSFCYDKRMYWTALGREERLKQEFHQNMTRDEYLNSILEDLTPDDIRHLIQFEDELTQLVRFEKVFPTPKTHVYHQFFEAPRYYNMMLDAWENKYQNNRMEGIKLLDSLCQQKMHLVISFSGSKLKPSQSQSDLATQVAERDSTEEKSEADSDGEKELEFEKETENIESEQATSLEAAGARKMKPHAGISSPVSKSVVRTAYSLDISPKYNFDKETNDNTSTEEKSEPPDPDYSFKLLGEVQGNPQTPIQDSKSETIKQYPNCKLENSMSESINNGKNMGSPKHIHNACIN